MFAFLHTLTDSYAVLHNSYLILRNISATYIQVITHIHTYWFVHSRLSKIPCVSGVEWRCECASVCRAELTNIQKKRYGDRASSMNIYA